MTKRILLIVLMLWAQSVFAANYSLEIIQPQPSLSATNRYYKAYTGLEYKVPVGVIGGVYPYTFSLTVAPSGMTINSSTGVITWSSPSATGSPHDVTVSVTDSESTTVTRSWTVTVNTSNAWFVDAVGGTTVAGGCAGTLASPCKTIKDIMTDLSGPAGGDIVYFRTGTYDISDYTPSNPGCWYRVEMSGSTKPLNWIAYPGESPVINFRYPTTDPAPLIRLNGTNIFISGFSIQNCDEQCFQTTAAAVFYNNAFSSLTGCTDGCNSAFIMTVAAGTFKNYTLISNNTFTTTGSNCSVTKTYEETKMLIEANTISGITGSVEGIAVKGDHEQATVRKNYITTCDDRCIDGNMQTANDTTIEFNKVIMSNVASVAMRINQGADAGQTYINRNTIVGIVQMDTVGETDGPFTFTNNVIVNNDETNANHLTYNGTPAAGRITNTNDLVGVVADGIVDGDGKLQGSYRTTYLGTRGYELSTAPTRKLNNVTGVRVTLH